MLNDKELREDCAKLRISLIAKQQHQICASASPKRIGFIEAYSVPLSGYAQLYTLAD